MIKSMLKTMSAVFVAVCLSVPAWSQSASVSSEDAARIRSVIDSQIAAFRRDDGENAYSHAAPSIQRIFPSVSAFMAMVKKGYAPVYRPQSYQFEDLRMGEKGPIQTVSIVGPSNRQWVAVYTFEKQPDGTWKITGVFIQPAPGKIT